jgi:hypothetical protein
MSQRFRPPAGSYFDDPAANLDRAQNDDALASALTKLEVIRFYEWINRGDARQRALRSDLVSLCLCPQLLPCKHPSAAWCAREHAVSREYASRLQRDFVRQFGDYIQLRGQRSPPGRGSQLRFQASTPQGRPVTPSP